ncbi:MAG: type II toxin-antitoxin system RelE/ParE family toxin [Pirellulales bacterium]|nr:type II toxin-antitoxin system RelE/ParE family toxin [Pirellulales bacterium]
MARIIWSDQSLEDVKNIIAYIAKDAPLTAKRFAQRIESRVDKLSKNSFLGGYIFEAATKKYRELIQGNYRIIYRIDGQNVQIVTIYHAARLLDIGLLD